MGNIKTFSQFVEAATKEITVTFGRFNPPTVGHGKLLDKTASVGRTGYRIYASHSVDAQKNPLQYEEKVKLLRKMFPQHARSIILDKKVNTILDIASKAYADGFTRLNVVVGSDRVDEFERLLNKYDGVKMANGYYSFPDGIVIVSAGERDPDAEGVEGMSASKMREAAAKGNFKEFSKGLPHGFGDATEVFNLLRKRMGLKETVDFRTHIQLPQVSETREKFVKGEALLIGERVMVSATGEAVRVIERGPNFVVTESADKLTKKRWLKDVMTLKEGWATDAYNTAGGKGLYYIDKYDERVELTKPSEIKNALTNLDKLDPKYARSFKIFKNLNGAVAFQEVAWVPFIHLI
jgi:hypothetical protein